MENNTAVELLDTFLNYFVNADEQYILLGKVANHFRLSMTPVSEIVDRLVLDGNLKAVENTMLIPGTDSKVGSDFKYSITFDGRLFYEGGGYKEQKRLAALKNAEIETKNKIAARNDKRLVWGTWAAAIAAFLVIAWQVFTYFYPSHT